MINFEILGAVRAWDDGWEAKLQDQHKAVLAALLIADGALVPWSELERALGWDEKDLPVSRGPAKPVSELRTRLQPALPGRAPLHGGNGAYRLPVGQRQVDVLRFRGGVAEARRTSGPERARLMRAALSEWGPGAVGLYGGDPLSDLKGAWAESTRFTLRKEHRDAVLDCIIQDMDAGQYGHVTRECFRLASPEALTDEAFVERWMKAACWSGQRTLAEQVFRQAVEATKRILGITPSRQLYDLAQAIRDEDPGFGAPDLRSERAVVAVRDPAGVPALVAAGPVPAPSLARPAGREHPARTERTAVNEPNVTFNISGNARVSGPAIGVNQGDLTIYPAPVQEASGEADDNVDDPDSPDRDHNQ